MDGVKRMRKEKRQQLATEGRKMFDRAYRAESLYRDEMLDDLRFSWGDQWDQKDREERERKGRPCLTVDLLADAIRKAMVGLRQARPSVKVYPVEDADEETAEIYTDLVREIEYASGGSAPYLYAAELAMRCGYGVFEVCQVDSDVDMWTQELRIKRIPNPFTVYFDDDSKHPVKADARFAIKTSFYSPEMFKEKWPNAEATSFSADGQGDQGRWFSDGDIRVATVYKRVPKNRTLLLLSDGRTVYMDEVTQDDAQLQVLKTRDVKSYEIHKWTQTENEILEGPQVWPGRYIPIIPVYGEEMNVAGEVQYRGMVRPAKDPQRMVNLARTTQAEILATQPRAPWMIGLSQLPGNKYEGIWARANDPTVPFLPYNDSTNPNPPMRQPPPVSSSGFLQESLQSMQDVQRTTGIYDAQLGAPGPEVSGRAILARQIGGDEGMLVFADHLAQSIEQCGRVLVDLIPHFYDTERVVRLRGEDDSQREVVLNQPQIQYNPESGQIEKAVKHDLSRGKYDVRVVVGKSYQAKKLEAQDWLMTFLQQVPSAAPLIADLVAKSQEGPYSDEIAERLKAMVPPGVVDEDDPEREQQMQAQAEKAQMLEAKQLERLQAEIDEIKSKIAKNLASAREDTTDAELNRIRAETGQV